jgi:hypothetical protein
MNSNILELGLVGLILLTMAELSFWIYVTKVAIKLLRNKDESK